jgi:hypothetical protein
MAKIFKQSSQSCALVFLGEHFLDFMNFVTLIFPYQTFDNDTIFIGMGGPWSVRLFLWIIIQYRSAIFKFVTPHRHFLSAEDVLLINTH